MFFQICNLQPNQRWLSNVWHGSSHRFRNRRSFYWVHWGWVSGEQLCRWSGQALRFPAPGEQDHENSRLSLSGTFTFIFLIWVASGGLYSVIYILIYSPLKIIFVYWTQLLDIGHLIQSNLSYFFSPCAWHWTFNRSWGEPVCSVIFKRTYIYANLAILATR